MAEGKGIGHRLKRLSEIAGIASLPLSLAGVVLAKWLVAGLAVLLILVAVIWEIADRRAARRARDTIEALGAGELTAAPAVLPPPVVCDLRRLPPSTSKRLRGRGEQLSQMREAVTAREKSLVLIDGFTGSGKTALVNTFLNEASQHDYYDARFVYAWRFFSGPDGDDSSQSPSQLWEQLLARLGFAGEAPNTDSAKVGLVLEYLSATSSIVVLDGLERVQSKDPATLGELNDQAMLEFLTAVARGALRGCGLVIVTSRLPVPELREFTTENGPVLSISNDDLMLDTKAGAELLTDLGVSGTAADLERAVEEVHGHALALTLMGRVIARDFHGDILQRFQLRGNVGDNDPVGQLLDYYSGYWETTSIALILLRIIASMNRPATFAEIEHIRSHAQFASSLGSATLIEVRRTLTDLKHLGLVLTDDDVIESHSLVRDFFFRQFREADPDGFKECHRLLSSYFSDAALDDQPDSLEGLDPLYRAVYHGCHGGRTREMFQDVYLPRISRGRRFFNAGVLGDRTGDLELIRALLPGGLDNPGDGGDLDDVSRAWLLAKAAFDLTALGRFADSLAPRTVEISMFSRLGISSMAAEDSRRLMHIYISLGRLQEALQAADQALTLALDAVDAGADDSPVSFLKLPEPSEVLEKCSHERGYLLMLLGRYEEADAEFSRLPHAREQRWRLLGKVARATTAEELDVLRQEIVQTDGQSWMGTVDADTDRILLGEVLIRLGRAQEGMGLLADTHANLQRSSRLDKVPRLNLVRAEGFRCMWRDTGEERFLRESLSALAQLDTFVAFSKAKLVEIDAASTRARILAAQGDRITAVKVISDALSKARAIGYRLAADLLEDLMQELSTSAPAGKWTTTSVAEGMAE